MSRITYFVAENATPKYLLAETFLLFACLAWLTVARAWGQISGKNCELVPPARKLHLSWASPSACTKKYL